MRLDRPWRGRTATVLLGVLVFYGAPGLSRTVASPEFSGITHWLNTPRPATRDSLKGKVVLVDFWTYSCINCIRAMPYLKAWHEKYHSQGLEIVGVHTPEFHFEKEMGNVQEAIRKFALPYPIAMDDNYQTWDAYASRSWPSDYLVDRNGVIRFHHVGEGDYEQREKEIQALLSEQTPQVTQPPLGVSVPGVDLARIKTPEIYLGLLRLASLGNSETVRPEEITTFKEPSRLKKNKVYLVGQWHMAKEYAELASGEGKVLIRFEANRANAVLSTRDNAEVPTDIRIDGSTANAHNHGEDVYVIEGRWQAMIHAPRMYNLSQGDFGEHVIEIQFHRAGVRLYTLTFG